MKPKENKINKTGSSSGHKVLSVGSRVSVGNKSPANANHVSGSRGSREQFPMDQLNGKRHNSLGSLKPDHTDQETTGDSGSSNNFLPHFM